MHIKNLSDKEHGEILDGLWYICIIAAIILFAKCNPAVSSGAFVIPH